MGLRVSHGAFEGSYASYHKLCRCVAEATGGSFTEAGTMQWGVGFGPDTHPGLEAMLLGWGRAGWISSEQCALLAGELEALLPRIEAMGWTDGGDIGIRVSVADLARQFADGCRCAAAAGEPLLFQ